MPLEGGDPAAKTVVLGDNGNANSQQQTQTQNSGGDGKTAGADYLAALSQENRQYAEKKGWKDLDAQVTSYRELERAHSQKSQQTNGQQQQQQQTQTQAPVLPASAADYEFKLPTEFPQDGFYDKNLSEKFKTWAHKSKLDQTQAQSLHDAFVNDMAGLMKNGREAEANQFKTKVEAAFNDLTKTWGSPDTPGFKRSLELSRRAMENLEPGLKDALKAHGVIATDAKGQEIVVNSAIVKALAKAGGRLFAEDELFGAKSAAENPFDPKKPNLAKQGELIKSNPELAKNLIEAAGAKEWQWWINKTFPTKK